MQCFCQTDSVSRRIMPVNELQTRFDKWLFVLKNLHELDRIPDDLRENIFEKLFETVEIAKFNQEEYQACEDSLK